MDTSTGVITVHPIDPAVLARIRRDGVDGFGNTPEPFTSRGGEQLRCCLRHAARGERLWVVGHAPLTVQRPWREVGPVFVHADPCVLDPGHDLLVELAGAPRVLRGYSSDQAMVYAANRVTAAGDDLTRVLVGVFDDHPDVTEIHLRNLAAQCFIARVTRA